MDGKIFGAIISIIVFIFALILMIVIPILQTVYLYRIAKNGST